jgi:superfamily II DNA or RNA helicase
MDYMEFVERKSQLSGEFGFTPIYTNDKLYDFQNALVEWAVKQGRGAIFADCGLGKTLMQLSWSQNVVQHENKPVLILAPLSVAMQSVEEANNFGFDAKRIIDGKLSGSDIVISNYQRLHYFNPEDFAGVVCDESSIMKNFDGANKAHITEFMKKVKYRLLCTATPSPNDYIELGTSSEALGHLGYMDMLGMFFKNDENNLHPAFMGTKWRFKSHAKKDFWRWVCSWARAVRKPSDLGFDDGAFTLPGIIENEHVVESSILDGFLIPVHAANMQEEREERRNTIELRCNKVAELMNHNDFGVLWCHYNAEADLLEKIVPNSKQVSGADSDDKKEEIFESFRKGQIKKLITKPKIAAFGMNWQHCNHHTYFADHSFEQYYQAIRRSWRFGQKRDVTIDVITTESLSGVTKNLRRKSEAAEVMFKDMVESMNNILKIKQVTKHEKKEEIPTWL